jgi:hypothetical protein
MVMENKHGQTGLNTSESGEKIELMEKVDLFTLMEIFMMGSGPMTKQMGQVYISMLTELNTKENGKMTYSMGKELKPGLTGQNMKEITHSEGNTVSVLINGMMDHSIQVTGAKIKSLE